jgi:hypothetical protein
MPCCTVGFAAVASEAHQLLLAYYMCLNTCVYSFSLLIIVGTRVDILRGFLQRGAGGAWLGKGCAIVRTTNCIGPVQVALGRLHAHLAILEL